MSPDPRRTAVIADAVSQLVDCALHIRARTGNDASHDILGDLPAIPRITVAQLAVAADQAGMRLIIGVEPK